MSDLTHELCANCNHEQGEHFQFKFSFKRREVCYGLDFNGTIYSSCSCKRFVIKKLGEGSESSTENLPNPDESSNSFNLSNLPTEGAKVRIEGSERFLTFRKVS